MIHEVKMYAMTCDGCGKDLGVISEFSAWADESSLIDDAESYDWIEHNGKYYCPDCYEINDNDSIILIKKEDE